MFGGWKRPTPILHLYVSLVLVRVVFVLFWVPALCTVQVHVDPGNPTECGLTEVFCISWIVRQPDNKCPPKTVHLRSDLLYHYMHSRINLATTQQVYLFIITYMDSQIIAICIARFLLVSLRTDTKLRHDQDFWDYHYVHMLNYAMTNHYVDRKSVV